MAANGLRKTMNAAYTHAHMTIQRAALVRPLACSSRAWAASSATIFSTRLRNRGPGISATALTNRAHGLLSAGERTDAASHVRCSEDFWGLNRLMNRIAGTSRSMSSNRPMSERTPNNPHPFRIGIFAIHNSNPLNKKTAMAFPKRLRHFPSQCGIALSSKSADYHGQALVSQKRLIFAHSLGRDQMTGASN